jgi:hypothetical protein
VSLLREALRGLADRPGHQLAIDALPFVSSVGNCRLRAVSAQADVGLMLDRRHQTSNGLLFQNPRARSTYRVR